jgi:hypothetical protein
MSIQDNATLPQLAFYSTNYEPASRGIPHPKLNNKPENPESLHQKPLAFFSL